MDRARARNLKMNPEKIQFKLKKIAFVGFHITEEGVSPDPSRIQAITQMPVPTSTLAVQRFIGMVNYSNTFCPAIAETISPLHSLTRQDQPFVWADIHQHSFAKELIKCSPCLAYSDVTQKVVLQVDACDTALGGTLLQLNGQGKLQPVAFTDCLMHPNEQRWAQIEKEALDICVAKNGTYGCMGKGSP